MPSLTSSQQGYAPAPPPTVEPVPVYQDPPPEQQYVPPPDTEVIPLQTGRTAAPVQQATPPPQDTEIIPLQTGRTAPVAEAPAATAPAEAPKEGPTPIRDLGVQTEQTKADAGRGVGQILSGDIGGGLGTIKDAAASQMAAQGGDLFPWRRMTTNAIVEEWANGEPSADAPWQDRAKDALLTGTGDSDPFVRFMDED